METFIEFASKFWPEMTAGTLVAAWFYCVYRIFEKIIGKFSAKATLIATTIWSAIIIWHWIFPDARRVAPENLGRYDIFYATLLAIFWCIFITYTLRKHASGKNENRP